MAMARPPDTATCLANGRINVFQMPKKHERSGSGDPDWHDATAERLGRATLERENGDQVTRCST